MTLAILMICLLYFLPWVVAAARRHHNSAAVLALNFLLGWTVVGWIVAFVWACTATRPREVASAAPAVPPSSAARFCTKCGSPSSTDARFCARCGAAAAPEPKVA